MALYPAKKYKLMALQPMQAGKLNTASSSVECPTTNSVG